MERHPVQRKRGLAASRGSSLATVFGLTAFVYTLTQVGSDLLALRPGAVVIAGCFLLAAATLLTPIPRNGGSLHLLPAWALAWLAAIGSGFGLLPFNGAIVFAFYAASWLVAARSPSNSGAAATLVMLALGIALALLDSLGDTLELDLLYPWYHRTNMSASLAPGAAALGGGFWLAVFRCPSLREYFAHEDRKIHAIGIAILLVTALGAGLTGFAILAHTVEGVAQNGLALSLRDRANEFETTVSRAAENLVLFSQRSRLIEPTAKSAHGQALIPAELTEISDMAAGLRDTLEIKAITIEDGHGRRLAENGSWWQAPEISYALPVAHGGQRLVIAWQEGMLLRAEVDILKRGKPVGRVLAEMLLPAADRLFQDGTGLGETGAMLVCIPLGDLMQCFPNRHHGAVITPRNMNGAPVPMDHALNGHVGVVRNRDIEGHQVFSAYRPIGNLGIGMVLEIRAEELYAPIRTRFNTLLLVLAALALAGMALFRWQIAPIARKLVHEIRERARAESELSKLSYALDKSPVAVAIADCQGRVEYVNPTFTALTGYTREEAVGRTPGSMLGSGRTPPEVYREMWGSLEAGAGWTGEIENRRKDGRLFWANEMILPIFNQEGETTHFLAMQQDITERKATEERLSFLANHDTLTGLPNRVLFTDRLQQAIIDADRHERLVGIMFLDLDRFKTINDTLGHSVGDELLKQVSVRLTQCMRSGDTISRLGGDEFTIILADVAHIDDLSAVAQKILNALASSFSIAGHELFVTGSIGVTVYPFDDREPESLVRNADAAMYSAKEQGRNAYQFYTAELNQRALRRLTTETALRHAAIRDEFRLHYQPQVDLDTGHVRGVEALIRWERPGVGLVPPAEFIPLAEETGLIVEIGEWALRTACAQARAWHELGFDSLRVAVNLSSRQFQSRGLADAIARILLETGFDAGHVDLEITESILIKNIDAAILNMEAMRCLGISFSLDDFGTGYSSLTYLRRLPLESLKLDRSFVEDCAESGEVAALATGVIAMAQALGIKVIAEGVETGPQLAFLRERGCDAIQGYYFSQPLPAGELTALLRQGRSLPARRPRVIPHPGTR